MGQSSTQSTCRGNLGVQFRDDWMQDGRDDLCPPLRRLISTGAKIAGR